MAYDTSEMVDIFGTCLTLSHRVIRWAYHETGQLQMLISRQPSIFTSSTCCRWNGWKEDQISYKNQLFGATSRALNRVSIFWAFFFKNLSFSRCERVKLPVNRQCQYHFPSISREMWTNLTTFQRRIRCFTDYCFLTNYIFNRQFPLIGEWI